MNDHGKPWFAAKRHGIGVGRPIAVEGWIFIAVVVLLAGLGGQYLRGAARIAWLVALVLIALPVTAAKTEGGWRWRWGKEK